MEAWIPVIIAVCTTLVAILNYFGKTKQAKALQIVVDAVETTDNKEAKETVAMNTRELPDLSKIIQKAKREAEAKR